MQLGLFYPITSFKVRKFHEFKRRTHDYHSIIKKRTCRIRLRPSVLTYQIHSAPRVSLKRQVLGVKGQESEISEESTEVDCDSC